MGPPDSLPTAWALAARAKLRNFLPAGPLYTLSPFYAWTSSNGGPLGDNFPGYRDAVEEAAGTLCDALGQGIGVPPEDVSVALRYTFGPSGEATGLHGACSKYMRDTPVRDPRLLPLPLFARTRGMELYKRVSIALTCGPCESPGSAERQCAHCGTLLCSSCSTRCSLDCAGGCAFALCPGCMEVDEDERAMKPSVFALDEGIGLAQPLCDKCGVDLVCPLHQCMINHRCDRCDGKRCDEHYFYHPAFNFCSGHTPGCLGDHCDDCTPPEGGIDYCHHCSSSFCAVCKPLLKCPGVGGVPCMGGRCEHCYEAGVCPSCGHRA